MKDWQDLMVEHFGKDWATQSYNVGNVGEMVQSLLPRLLDGGETRLVAEVLAEKIVDLGAEMARLEMTVKMIKENTGFYDNNTDRYNNQIADLDREREELTKVFLRLYNTIKG